MWLYENMKRKLFLHKKPEIIELKEADLLNLFKEEISNEISVEIKKDREEN